MFDRLFWFGSGVVTGCVITIRALHQSPRGLDLRSAALHTGSDALRLTARLIRPPRRVPARRVTETADRSTDHTG